MNKIDYEHRLQTYTSALIQYGESTQMIVAIEELSEAQKEICKVLRGKGNLEHLAEELADATIMIEQLSIFFPINDMVCEKMDEKIKRLDDRLRGDANDSGHIEKED